MNIAVAFSSRILVRSHRSHFAVGVLMSLILAGLSTPASAASRTYVEDFTTTTYKDTLNTTADWDTVGGELKLFPFTPTLIGTYNTPDAALGVAVAGDLAFVADYHSGLQVIDISDPSNPVLIGTCDTPGCAQGVAVAGDVALVADGHRGLLVIDISDPSSPVRIGTCDTPGSAWDVAVSGDLALVADYDSGLQVIDISDPSNPVLIGTYDTPGHAYRVAGAGDLAFVADYYGLQVIDIIDPSNPVLIGTCDTPGLAWGVAVAGDLAFVADGASGLQVIDISDPSSPVLAGTCDTPGEAWGVAIAGDLAFVADYGSGLQVIDISDPSNPVLAGTCDTPGTARGVAVAGDLAFVGDYYSGLQVIDIIDPSNPVLIGTCDTPDAACGVAVAGDLAFVADHYSGLQVIDIIDPSTPVLIGTCDTPGWAGGVAVAGDLAFVGDGAWGLQVIRVYQGEFYVENNVGQSLAVDGASDTIPRARLTSTETGGVTWELSADAGVNWIAVAPNGSWTRIAAPGHDLLWRTTHTWSPGLNPTVSDLTLEWLNEHAFITSIADVPNDQGGWVRLSFTRSGYDFADEDSLPVTGYQVYRRVDDGAFRMRIRDKGVIPTESQYEGTMLACFEPKMIRTLDGRDFLLGGSNAQGEFPPGEWEFLTWVGATQSDTYVGSVPTVADSSTTGIAWSVYLVTTHTTTPSIWFASEPDSGYSVDNIAPSAPQNLVFGEPGVLQWDAPIEEDFAYHTVYGSESEVFDETATVIGYTVDPTFDVSGDPYEYYHVTTSDAAGNESGAATIESPVSSTPGGNVVPALFAIRGARPNPFQMGTSIGFDLPEANHLRLTIFDSTGRLVRVVIEDHQPAGRHQVAWDGTNESGQRVAPGIYFARIAAGSFKTSKRLVMIR